ncbi:MAG: hypothetical protein ACLPHP_01010 [Candidatus Sulfotelmatobacter sp.]
MWFAIMLPTTLLADLVLLWADRQVKTIFKGVPLFEILHHWDKVVEAYFLRFGSFFAAWFLGCFALATIASVVNGLEEESEGPASIPDRHQRAREHIRAVFVVALITFCAFLAGFAISEFVQSAAIRAVGWRRFSRFSYAASLIAIVTVASLVSWLGASIPLLLRGTKLWAALKRSVELSSGYEGALFLLVVESVAGTFIAGYGTVYALHLLVPSHLRYMPWYGWVVNLAAVLASAAVEPPLFIGLSLLADPERLNPSSLPASQHPA